MTTTEVTSPPDAPDIQQAPPRRWYKRRSVLVCAAVVIVILITVVSDLPQHASRSAQIASAKSVMSEVNSDVGACSYALGESLTIYRDLRAHSLTPADSAEAPRLLSDDQAACSYTDDSIYQLSNIEVPGSAAGKHLGDLVYTVSLWATSDALNAIEKIQTLYSDPQSSTAARELTSAEADLGRDRAQAEAQLAAADNNLWTRLPGLSLTRVSGS